MNKNWFESLSLTKKVSIILFGVSFFMSLALSADSWFEAPFKDIVSFVFFMTASCTVFGLIVYYIAKKIWPAETEKYITKMLSEED